MLALDFQILQQCVAELERSFSVRMLVRYVALKNMSNIYFCDCGMKESWQRRDEFATFWFA